MLIRHFPDGLSREPLQAGNVAYFDKLRPPRQDCAGCFDIFPVFDRNQASLRAVKWGNRSVFQRPTRVCADLLREEPRFPLFDLLPSRVT